MNAVKTFLLIVVAALGVGSAHAQTALPEIPLSIKGHKLIAEVAATDSSRTTGLMNRREYTGNLVREAYQALETGRSGGTNRTSVGAYRN